MVIKVRYNMICYVTKKRPVFYPVHAHAFFLVVRTLMTQEKAESRYNNCLGGGTGGGTKEVTQLLIRWWHEHSLGGGTSWCHRCCHCTGSSCTCAIKGRVVPRRAAILPGSLPWMGGARLYSSIFFLILYTLKVWRFKCIRGA